MIPVATQNTLPNLTLSQDARLHKYVRLPSGWKYLRADYSEGFGVKPHAVFLGPHMPGSVLNSSSSRGRLISGRIGFCQDKSLWTAVLPKWLLISRVDDLP